MYNIEANPKMLLLIEFLWLIILQIVTKLMNLIENLVLHTDEVDVNYIAMCCTA